MKKLLIRLGVIALIVFGIRDIYVRYHNLEYYSVYYASNLPHKEGTNPVLVMVARNFEKIKLPSNYTIRSGGGFSGPNFLDGPDLKMDIVRFSEITASKLHTSVYFDDKTGEYLRDSIYDKELARDVHFTDEQRQQFLSELDEFLADIVAVQEEPKLNLQDWFNSIYEKQFNE